MTKFDDNHKCLKRLYSRHNASCKNRAIFNKLTFGEYANLVQADCDYCGARPSNMLKYSGLRFAWNGIDRMESNKPYEMGNVLTSCSFCNSLKGSMKWDTWGSFLNGVIERGKEKGPFDVSTDKDRSSKKFFSR